MAKSKPIIEDIFYLWLGKNPLILFDTSSIIEMENRERVKHRTATPILETIASYYPVIITDEIMQEVKYHNENNLVSRGRKEISDSTYNLVKILYRESKEIEQILKINNNFDDVRLLAYWKCKEVEKEEKERKKQNCISECDYKLISKATWYSLADFRKNTSSEYEPISRVLVISQDRHIRKGLQKMIDEGYEKLLCLDIDPIPLENMKYKQNSIKT